METGTNEEKSFSNYHRALTKIGLSPNIDRPCNYVVGQQSPKSPEYLSRGPTV